MRQPVLDDFIRSELERSLFNLVSFLFLFLSTRSFSLNSSWMRDGSLEGSLKDFISTAGIPCKLSFNEFTLLSDRLLTLLSFILSSTKWSRAGTMSGKKVSAMSLSKERKRKLRSALIIKLIVNFYTGDHLDVS